MPVFWILHNKIYMRAGQIHITNLLSLCALVLCAQKMERPMSNVSATVSFAEYLNKSRPDIDLAALFVQSLRSLSEEDIREDRVLREKCASGMKSGIAEKIGMVEKNLDRIDFGIFVEEAIRAVRPMRVNFRTEKGQNVIMALPADIKGLAVKISDSWKDAALAAKAMLACAKEGDVAEQSLVQKNPEKNASGIPSGKVLHISCEPVKTPKRNPVWNTAKKIARECFNAAVGVTMAAIITVSVAASAMSFLNDIAPRESPKSVMMELAEKFGATPEKAFGMRVYREGMDKMAHDEKFDQLLKEDYRLRDMMEILGNMSPMLQVKAVNMVFNQLPGVHDKDNYGKDEYFAGPSEMWQNGGDCEDYSIIKYAVLRKLGFDKDDMHILAVSSKEREFSGHAVLAVKVDGDYHVLDNLHGNLLSMDETVVKYDIMTSLNETGITNYSHDSASSQKPYQSVMSF